MSKEPLFQINADLVEATRLNAESHESYVSTFSQDMRTYQPNLFAYYEKIRKNSDYEDNYYESSSIFMYDLLKKGSNSFPVNIIIEPISEDIMDGHEVTAKEIFNDPNWENNDWIMAQLMTVPTKTGSITTIPLQSDKPLSRFAEFWKKINSVSPQLGRLIFNTVKNFENPKVKKSLLRGIFDVFNPYNSLLEARNWSTKFWMLENQEQLEEWQKKFRNEPIGEKTSINDIISWAEDSLDE